MSNAELSERLKKAEKQISTLKKQVAVVKAHDAGDNIKFNIDFRASYNNFSYKMNDGTKVTNSSFLTNRLSLGMKAKPLDNLSFFGELAMYKTFGSNKINSTEPFQNTDWRGSSRPDDSTVKVRKAFFLYTINDDFSFSVGRRPSYDGFLANHREGKKNPGSPLAHITNMEVDAAMFKFNVENYIEALSGSYIKFVYGRTHDNVNETYSATPYIYDGAKNPIMSDNDVDFIVIPMTIYNDGQYNVMAQYANISNSKGIDADGNLKADAGTTHLASLGVQVDGLSEDNEFLEETTVFASVAMSKTSPDNGAYMLGSTESETGTSYWIGAVMPDMITDGGKFGLEYNHGSKYWTPMTWAEDTIVGSKIAARGDAYEAYWNIPILGDNLSAQFRYTHIDYDYRSNTICYMEDPDLTVAKNDGKFDERHGGVDTAKNFRFFLKYSY